MTFDLETGLLLTTAIIAGGINSIAGGGGLLVFPALLLTGIGPLSANATSAAAIWIGMVMSGAAFRHELQPIARRLWPVTIASLLGGLLGALLLLNFSDESFAGVVPYLIALGTVLFALSPRLIRLAQQLRRPLRLLKRGARSLSNEKQTDGFQPMRFNQPLLFMGQGGIALYGGFFGGGAGILMLSLLSLTNPGKIQTLQAVKIWMSICINAAALSYFVFANIISWPHVILMAVGTSIGGYSGVYIAKHIPAIWLRRVVIAMGIALTVYFFIEG